MQTPAVALVGTQQPSSATNRYVSHVRARVPALLGLRRQAAAGQGLPRVRRVPEVQARRRLLLQPRVPAEALAEA